MKEQGNKLEKRLISVASAGQINVLKKMLKKGGIHLDFQGDEKNLNFWAGGILRDAGWRSTKPPASRLGKCGNTALMWGCHLHRNKVAEALLDAGASPKITNLIGETALHLLDNNAASLVDKMVAAGADVNARNAWGATPLMMALHTGNPAVARKLLENGANPLLKTISGHDAFAIAEEAGTDASFIAQMRAMQETINYINDIKAHDWYYQYSDDHNVWRAGEAADKELSATQRKLDPDYLLWNKFAPKQFHHVDVPLKGKLIAFSETGTEGTVWCFAEEGKQGYDGLHQLQKGDVLQVFNDAAGKKEIWKGSVDFDYDKNKQPLPMVPSLTVQWVESIGTVHGLQKGVAPKKWAKMFLEEKPAQLIVCKTPPKPNAP